jgi:hypothetical protein
MGSRPCLPSTLTLSPVEKTRGDIAIPLGYEQDRGKGFAPLGFTAPLADTSR